jgi:uncharacterized protein YxjI
VWGGRLDVSINERSISFTSEYDISTPTGEYYARKEFFSFTDNLELRTASGNVVAKIEGEISPLRHKHDFHFSDGRECSFGCEKLWTRVYACVGSGETYKLYEHRGLNYSIFKEDRQIAAFSKNRVVFAKGNQYDVRLDHDADLILILCMVLTINSSENDDEDSTVTIDLGNLTQDHPFDESWEPR